jgi:hypothetical protein
MAGSGSRSTVFAGSMTAYLHLAGRKQSMRHWASCPSSAGVPLSVGTAEAGTAEWLLSVEFVQAGGGMADVAGHIWWPLCRQAAATAGDGQTEAARPLCPAHERLQGLPESEIRGMTLEDVRGWRWVPGRDAALSKASPCGPNMLSCRMHVERVDGLRETAGLKQVQLGGRQASKESFLASAFGAIVALPTASVPPM